MRFDTTAVADGEELSTFFEVSPDLLVVRHLDGRFSRVNDAWEAALGWSPEELEGTQMHRLLHPDDVAGTRGHLDRIEAGGEAGGYVNRYRHKDGSYRILEWRGKRVGQRLYGAARDITERRALEAQLAADREAAVMASKAKNDFLINISHEVRTPLNGVIGLVGVLARTELTQPQQEMVELIETSGATLERLLADLLDITKLEAGVAAVEAKPFGLNGLYALLETYRLLARDKGLAFELMRDAPADVLLVGDIVRVRQVLGNLLSNAVKFTSQGKVITRIAVARGEGDAVTLRLEVEDTGFGFDTTTLTRAEVEGPISREYGGAGLGLSVCRTAVAAMGGRLSARSEAGRGSLFSVEIPLTVAEPAAAPADEEDERLTLAEDGAPLRILMAEDHPINQRVVQLILEAHGVSLTTVDNGAEAVAAFRTQTFDMVLMDMQMPVMDGLEAVRTIRMLEGRGTRTPIAVLSANAQPQHHAASLAAGADLHIAKPVTAEGLLAGLNAAMATRQDGVAARWSA